MKKFHMLANVAAIIAISVALAAGYVGYERSQEPMQLEPSVAEMIPQSAMPAVEVPKRGGMTDNLLIVFYVGKEVGNPETLQAILMQESGGRAHNAVGNTNSPVGKRSYGLMQVQLAAARSVLQRYPKVYNKYFAGRKYGSVMDEEIIALLLTNDEANARIAAYHFKLYLTMSDGDWDRAVAAYNAGIGGVENIPNPSEYQYVVDVREKMADVVRPFNQKHGLKLPA